MSKKKFFTRKWYFWVVVVVNWIWILTLTEQFSLLDYPLSFFGSFIVIFVIWLSIWSLVRLVKYIIKDFKKKQMR